MAKGPAVVVVARHGARLDAADKTWHLTSPTPYDPPLTYGGWMQGKALGQRIAALLYQRDHELAATAAAKTKTDPSQLGLDKLHICPAEHGRGRGEQRPNKKKKKRKIVIHTSPFLRCVQTSTAIAAGITQYESLPATTPTLKTPAPPSKDRKSPLGNGSASTTSSSQSKTDRASSPRVQPLFDPNLDISYKPRAGPDKILLRVDAFLGEWLSPDYYADITPPPASTMMVAGAKAGLLRRGDQILEMAANSTKGHFPGGWGGKSAVSNTKGPSSQASGMGTAAGSLAQASAFRERSSSDASTLTLQRSRSREAAGSMSPAAHVPAPGRAYEPPAPTYSVTPSDPIPRGYVAHAQDACIQVDFQWDSMRPPQDWGDGGEYGDEWSTMHKRFRRGISGMMEWYHAHGAEPPKEHVPGFMFKVLSNKPSPPPPSRPAADPSLKLDNNVEAEEDEELVLILVTHGAGCNALLGAMSNQPVLIDVGLASLSMAVRRETPMKAAVPTLHERRLSVADPGMAETYEMKLLASVDHLRPGVDPAKPPQAQPPSQSPAVVSNPSLDSRRRLTGLPAANSPIDSPFSMGESNRSWNSSLGSVRRTTSTGSRSMYTSSFSTASGAASPSGLWSGARTPVHDTGSDGSASPGADFLSGYHQHQPKPKPRSAENAASTPPNLDGSTDTLDPQTKMDDKEERETGDMIAPLVKAQDRKSGSAATASASAGLGLWGAKAAQPKAGQGLWGPPRLDDVYEHGRGPKRRWTVTEREERS
ncbi:hypothetical protein IAQ61_009906 [Plenodomus lingam]|uniref:Phosphoglycerate mutase family protein n=1 Tax=Leptosphaeria maculans (strain JN3 / isolate v23.1.3 / race Av1-4-5-6-7-8) TaxID=985895 RepID=E4ZSK8_LEPMJ|nr:hypothetical protein LEMA_P121520.1 [Plenodomus lingam JN3]KAH9862489.1 hypothetical protein IAQ61_009906 [Plenodomus lingam]CBX94388.1 hypothetical protein LEMA_P121520.1 [Plenodomus lingam JN3]